MEEELYKDISEIKKGLEGMRGKKEITSKELYESVQSLNTTITGMLEVFGAAAEQMKLEEQSYEASSKKHEMIVSKLDKLIDQNKTIAEGMVAIVEMVKEKAASQKEEPMFKPRQEPRQFIRPQQEWKPMPEQKPAFQQQPLANPMQLTPPIPAVPEMGMPSMQPTQDTDFPEFDLGEDEPKKKGLFGMFKK